MMCYVMLVLYETIEICHKLKILFLVKLFSILQLSVGHVVRLKQHFNVNKYTFLSLQYFGSNTPHFDSAFKFQAHTLQSYLNTSFSECALLS